MTDLEKCPHCATVVESSVRVCRGCGAEVVYGPTTNEMGGCGCALAVVFGIAGTAFATQVLSIPEKKAEGWGGGGALIGFVIGFILSFVAYKGRRFLRSYRHRYNGIHLIAIIAVGNRNGLLD